MGRNGENNMRTEKPNIQREAILRFWTSMNNLDYDEVVKEYLGQADHISLMVSNKLYANVEAAIHFMNFIAPKESENDDQKHYRRATRS